MNSLNTKCMERKIEIVCLGDEGKEKEEKEEKDFFFFFSYDGTT